MSINKDTIKKISKLSRISVSNEETDRLEKDLNSILKFVEQLKELNTDKIAPIASDERLSSEGAYKGMSKLSINVSKSKEN